jgi:hypothetical protein
VSRATNSLFALENVTIAKPIFVAKTGVKSTLTKPRTPEVPKSFDFNSFSPNAHFMVKAENVFK